MLIKNDSDIGPYPGLTPRLPGRLPVPHSLVIGVARMHLPTRSPDLPPRSHISPPSPSYLPAATSGALERLSTYKMDRIHRFEQTS